MEATDESQPGLASTVHAADPRTSVQLTKGFHAVEQNAWRWTMGQFAMTLQPPAGAASAGASLTLKFSIPEAFVQRVKKTTVSASVQNTPVGSESYAAAGEHTLRADVPASLFKGDAVTVEISVDPFLPAGTLDERELGVVFVSASLDPK